MTKSVSKLALLLLPSALLSTAVFAEDYRAEANVNYISVDGDGGSVDAFGMNGAVYIKTVDTSNGPLAEAAFTSRSSNVYVTHIDGDAFSLSEAGIEAYIGGMVYANVSVFNAKIGAGGLEGNNDAWQVTAGVTPVDGLRVTTTLIQDIDYNLNLDVKYLTPLSGDRAFNIEGGYADGEEGADAILTLAGDYYINRSTGFGAGLRNQDETNIFFRVSHFVTPKFKLGASFELQEDANAINLNLGLRF